MQGEPDFYIICILRTKEFRTLPEPEVSPKVSDMTKHLQQLLPLELLNRKYVEACFSLRLFHNM